MLVDYELSESMMNLFINNSSAIQISRNPVQHSRTKHIDIHHHFICDLVKEKIIFLDHVSTEEQLADILTKALDSKRFKYL